jgi:hypothetical protein
VNSTRVHLFVIALVFTTISIAATTNDSVIGYWRTVKSESNDPDYRSPKGELEMRLATGGAVIVKFRSGTSATNDTYMVVGKFTLIPPDRITITLDNKTEEHYRYLFKDGQLRMEHLDYAVTNTLKRLKAFSL